MIILPRQARDKHRETQKDTRFLIGIRQLARSGQRYALAIPDSDTFNLLHCKDRLGTESDG